MTFQSRSDAVILVSSYLRPIIFSKVQLRHQFLQEAFLNIPHKYFPLSECFQLCPQSCFNPSTKFKIWSHNLHSLRFLQPTLSHIRISGFSWELENLTPRASIPTWPQLGRVEKQLSVCRPLLFSDTLPTSPLWGWLPRADYSTLVRVFFLQCRKPFLNCHYQTRISWWWWCF